MTDEPQFSVKLGNPPPAYHSQAQWYRQRHQWDWPLMRIVAAGGKAEIVESSHAFEEGTVAIVVRREDRKGYAVLSPDFLERAPFPEALIDKCISLARHVGVDIDTTDDPSPDTERSEDGDKHEITGRNPRRIIEDGVAEDYIDPKQPLDPGASEVGCSPPYGTLAAEDTAGITIGRPYLTSEDETAKGPP